MLQINRNLLNRSKLTKLKLNYFFRNSELTENSFSDKRKLELIIE